MPHRAGSRHCVSRGWPCSGITALYGCLIFRCKDGPHLCIDHQGKTFGHSRTGLCGCTFFFLPVKYLGEELQSRGKCVWL